MQVYLLLKPIASRLKGLLGIIFVNLSIFCEVDVLRKIRGKDWISQKKKKKKIPGLLEIAREAEREKERVVPRPSLGFP